MQVEPFSLAEFIIHLGQTSADPSEFGTKLAATGTEFPPGFVQSLFATIQTMSLAIEAARAPKTRPSASSSSAAAGGDVVYKAMAIPDMPGPVPLRGMAHESDPATRGAAASSGGSSSSSSAAAAAAESTTRPGKRGREGDAAEADRVVRARGAQSSAYGALGIPPPDPPRAPLKEPELYGIYDGTISKLMDFGAFVELEGFARGERIEGLVHVSRLANHGMVKKAEDVVSRGQKVKVKVLMMGTGKLTLSMRDVDQKTGKDLMPRAADGSLAVPDRGPRRKGKSSLGLSDEKIAHLKTLGKVSSFMYRYILRESCSQFDSLPLTSLTIFLGRVERSCRWGTTSAGSLRSCAKRGSSTRRTIPDGTRSEGTSAATTIRARSSRWR